MRKGPRWLFWVFQWIHSSLHYKITPPSVPPFPTPPRLHPPLSLSRSAPPRTPPVEKRSRFGLLRFASMEEENWDLYSVVRGFMGETATAAEMMGFEGDGFSFSSIPPSLDAGSDDFLFCIPDLHATQSALQELEELCKPFLPPQPPPQQQEHQGNPSSSAAAFGGRPVGGLLPPSTPQPRQQSQPRALSTPRSKKRKNQQKRVVCQVPADGVSSDVWAWRKYGQKPIKGSPYPRGYYRCSSSKGCVARKQVERSRTDPATFVITYTGEHNHPVPTHRNSLAGSTRNKFPTSKTQQVNADPAATKASSSSSPASTGLSSMEDEQQANVGIREPKQEGGEEEVEQEVGAVEGEKDEDEGMLLVSDMLGDEDIMFVGFEELQCPPTPTTALADGGLLPDCQFSAALSSYSSPWVASNAPAATAGWSC